MRVTKHLSLHYHKAKTKFIYLRVFCKQVMCFFLSLVFFCLILQYSFNTSDEQQVKFVFFSYLVLIFVK